MYIYIYIAFFFMFMYLIYMLVLMCILLGHVRYVHIMFLNIDVYVIVVI